MKAVAAEVTTLGALDQAEAAELVHCETVIDEGMKTFVEVGTALLTVREKRLYRAEHRTFEEYCRERWGMNRDYANKMISAAKVVGNLDTIVSTIPATESQARPLTSLPPEQQQEAWAKAVETAPGGKVTAAHVKSVVADMARAAATADAVSPEIDGVARGILGQDEEGDEEDEEAEAPATVSVRTPVEPAVPEAFGDRWLKMWDGMQAFFISIPRRGGIVNLVRGWTPSQRQRAAAKLRIIAEACGNYAAEMEKEYGRG